MLVPRILRRERSLRPLIAVCAIALAGCPDGPPSPPRPLLVFTATWVGWGHTVVERLHTGAISLDDAQIQADIQASRHHCSFAADFANIPGPRPVVRGAPAAPPITVQIIWQHLNQVSGLADPCSPGDSATDVTMQPDPGLVIEAPTRAGSAEFDLHNGARFSTATGVFEFTLQTLDQQVAGGRYRYVMSTSRDPGALVVTGSFTALR